MNDDKKPGLHPRNKHKNSYVFKDLIKSHPLLSPFVQNNKFGNESIDFSNPEAVLALNTALLKHFYNIQYWDIPKGYLCPPIPGRADYIHQIADLLTPPGAKAPTGPGVKILDVGVGANCVYPLIAHREYSWNVVGTDIDEAAIKNANTIIAENHLELAISTRVQPDKKKIFENIIQKDDFFHATICNPPFHASLLEAQQGNVKKNRNLGLKKSNSKNFGGQSNELWCEGGEIEFITNMIKESVPYKKNCLWFTTLVSKSTTLPFLYEELKRNHITTFRTLDMEQGQKKTRILAWKF